MLASIYPRVAESRYRLLYLGSDTQFVTTLQSVLTAPDYRLVTCSEEHSAFLFLESKVKYDLLLVDFDWKGSDVLNLARDMRSLRHRRRLPIVVVSSIELSRRVKVRARQAGVEVCVVKMSDADAVAEVIKSRLEKTMQRSAN